MLDIYQDALNIWKLEYNKNIFKSNKKSDFIIVLHNSNLKYKYFIYLSKNKNLIFNEPSFFFLRNFQYYDIFFRCF